MLVSNRVWEYWLAVDPTERESAMRDIDVRTALLQELWCAHSQEPETLIIDELGLCQGDVRVDLAVINGILSGFEIKSERDNLDRLPGQQVIYSRVFDFVTIVACHNHIDGIIALVPEWWAIWEASRKDNKVNLSPLRAGQQNAQVDTFSLVQLLWRDEALSLIHELNLASKASRKPRKELWSILAASLSAAELSFHVCRQIKSRRNWRSATGHNLCGVTFRSSPM